MRCSTASDLDAAPVSEVKGLPGRGDGSYEHRARVHRNEQSCVYPSFNPVGRRHRFAVSRSQPTGSIHPGISSSTSYCAPKGTVHPQVKGGPPTVVLRRITDRATAPAPTGLSAERSRLVCPAFRRDRRDGAGRLRPPRRVVRSGGRNRSPRRRRASSRGPADRVLRLLSAPEGGCILGRPVIPYLAHMTSKTPSGPTSRPDRMSVLRFEGAMRRLERGAVHGPRASRVGLRR
jgi:hypothetical protein